MNRQDTEIVSLETLVEEMTNLVAGGNSAGAADWLRALMVHEDDLHRRNRMCPYEDRVPPLLAALPDDVAGAVFDELTPAEARRALFDNYTRIKPACIAAILAAMHPERAAAVVEAMSLGVDAPLEMARALSHAGLISETSLGPLLAHVHTASLARLVREMEADAQGWLLAAAGPDTAAVLLMSLTEDGGRVAEARAARMLSQLPRQAQTVILERLAPTLALSYEKVDEGRESAPALRGRLVTALRHLDVGPLSGLSDRQARLYLTEVTVEQAAFALARSAPDIAAAAMAALDAPLAATLLTIIAASEPALAADLLRGLDTDTLLGFRLVDCGLRCPRREPFAQASAGIVAALDLQAPPVLSLLRLLPDTTLEAILDRLPPARRGEVLNVLGRDDLAPQFPISELMTVGRGQRRTRRLDSGLRCTHIEERLQTTTGSKPVIIDLVEMNPAHVCIQARMATADALPVPSYQVASIFAEFQRTGGWPGRDTFRQLGLIQLSQKVRESGAMAGINGNHYYDYDHHINAITLGIDAARVPGLFFGDSIGWFVSDGQELSPPAFNRAALIVTADGQITIERVFATGVTLAGRRFTWEEVNAPKQEGVPCFYNSVFGAKTEVSDAHVDLAIAKGQVFAVSRDGGLPISFTGFVLSLPADDAAWIDDSIVGQPGLLTVHNNLPVSYGRVIQAMACGPHLVREGQMAIDFVAEDFGERDSTVMSFFLPRTVESYDAARSFMVLRDGLLTIGVVSDAAMGYGAPQEIGGMTFGELAQLALDLGADHAYALDGGGSSSIAVRHRGEVRTLDIPTGGADVGKEQERFINTYWLFYER
jgi:hypothetical protein